MTPSFINLYDNEFEFDRDRLPVLSGDEAVEDLAVRTREHRAGGYRGTIEIRADRLGMPAVRVIDLGPEAVRRADGVEG